APSAAWHRRPAWDGPQAADRRADTSGRQMISVLRKLVVVSIAVMIAPVFAQTAPPELPFADMSWKALSTRKPASRLKMGALDVRFEETTLKAISDAAGLGTMHHRGDGGGSIYWLCYTIRD